MLIEPQMAQGAFTQQAILLEVDEVSMVALASSNGFQIWQTNTQQNLLDWPCTLETSASSDVLYGGIAMVQAEDGTCVLCVGDSLGKVHAFALPAVDQARLSCTISNHQAAITGLASSAPDSSIASSNALASCDDNGTIVLCTVASSSSIQHRHRWEGRGMPCISVSVHAETLIAGFHDGSVQLYNMVSVLLLVLIHLCATASPLTHCISAKCVIHRSYRQSAL